MDKVRDDSFTTGSRIPQEPDEARAGDDPQATAAADVAADTGNTIQAPDTSDEPNAVDAVTYVGKRVFSPHELNQSGEDKEYFHPDKGHKFDAPKDANDHALTPDIEVTPDNTIKKIS